MRYSNLKPLNQNCSSDPDLKKPFPGFGAGSGSGGPTGSGPAFPALAPGRHLHNGTIIRWLLEKRCEKMSSQN